MQFRRFEPTIFQFLEELADNNNRPWFHQNKWRYDCEVLEPCLAFIRAFEPRLKKVSRFFVASDRRVGGSLMRVYRDTRFSKDKTPYKTNVGIQFRHEFGRDVHAPGFYVHIAPEECFLAVGVWRPDRESLSQIRQAIVNESDRWRRARNDRRFCEHFELVGDSLKRPP
ncbi:MAG: TIGR02453 family protein, partial [Planctomycetes bacterium RBG_16_64_12]